MYFITWQIRYEEKKIHVMKPTDEKRWKEDDGNVQIHLNA